MAATRRSRRALFCAALYYNKWLYPEAGDIITAVKVILRENNKYVIRFERDEELIEALVTFCNAEGIAAGSFFGIGAAEEIIIAYYNIDTREYEDKHIGERLEITGLAGNIAVLDGKTMIHSHGNFSDRTMRVFGGHVKKLVVSATCEVVLEKFGGKISRGYEPDVGLNLLQ